MESNYLLDRLRIDGRHVVELADLDGRIGHPGVKGRFRELLLNNLLSPWLPASMGLGTGLIVDHRQLVRDAGQDDIIVFDPILAPSILASSDSTHGVYLCDSVLCRIEVKSNLTKADVTDFAVTSNRVASLELVGRFGQVPNVFGVLNMLIAFDSEVAIGQELRYLCEALRETGQDPQSGIISALCIVNRGFWALAEKDGVRGWNALRGDAREDRLAYFVGFVSNTCFAQRAARQGTQPLGGGIGNYLGHPVDFLLDPTIPMGN